MSWYGQLDAVPNGFLLCDGRNGTPDLRDRFVVGAGSTYALNDIGGEAAVLLVASTQASHYHSFGYHGSNNNGYFISTADHFAPFPRILPTYPAKWNGSGGGSFWSWDGGSTFGAGQNLITSLAVGTDAEIPHENRPPYYALHYIIKI